MNYSANSNGSNVGKTEKLKKSDILLSKIENSGFNMTQLKGAIKTKGNQLIISIAGSGKTTALIFKIIYDITTGEATRVVEVNDNPIRVLDKIWVCTFLKSGAEELKSKLALWERNLGVIDTSDSMAFSTLHAEFKRALTALGVTTNIIDASVNSKNLKKVADKFALQYEGKPLVGDILRDLESALIYTRNRLDDKRYDRTIYEELEIGPTIIDTVLREWKAMRKELGCVDFEDLQELLYEECIIKGNIEVCNFLGNRYNYIYVDEFQDTSQIQYALLKIYARGCKKIVAIGDDDQTIYSWRGSYNRIITEEFIKDFNPVISELSVNYRCPEVILNAVKPSLEKNTHRFKKELKSANRGGVFRFGEYPSYRMMSESLCSMVYDDVKKNMSVSVLCRVNSDGLLPALMFDRMGDFQYTISGDGMTLDSYIGRSVINIARLFTERSTQAVRNSLKQMTWNVYSINNIMKVCQNNKVSFWEIPDEDLIYSCPDIARRLITWKEWRKSMGDIKALRLIYMTYRTEIYVKDTHYNTVCKSIILALETMLETTKATTVEDFLEDLEDINERLKARKKKFNGSKVRIATVHEYKGKEADSVYIWNDSEGIFPHKDCDLTDEEELEEERRVHYIACTRARKISTVMCLSGKSGMFVNEMDLSKAQKMKSLIGGVLERKGDVEESDKLLNDENYFDSSFNAEDREGLVDFAKMRKRLNSEDVEVSGEDKVTIVSMYKDGMDANDIFNNFIENGYDVYSLSRVEEVIDEYLKKKVGRI